MVKYDAAIPKEPYFNKVNLGDGSYYLRSGALSSYLYYLVLGSTTTALYAAGNILLARDDKGFLFGAGSDAQIIYNGTDLVLNPRLVGSGVVDFKQATGAAPGTPGTVAAWLDIKVNGVAYKLPLYQ